MTGIPEEIDTPDVVVDRDVLERNIERMAAAGVPTLPELDPETVAANRDAWIEEWTEIVLR